MDDHLFYETYGYRVKLTKEERDYIKVSNYVDYTERDDYAEKHYSGYYRDKGVYLHTLGV